MPHERDDKQTRSALRHLRKADKRLARIMDQVGPYEIQITRDPFVTLLGSIIHQQLSMKAAATIRARVRDLCLRKRMSAGNIMAISEHALRGAGLSRQKVRYFRDLSEHFLDGRLKTAALRRMDDEQVLATTTQVLGIGKWTAEMLLIFCLRRPDVWPVDDLGVQVAARKLLGKHKPLAKAKLQALGEPWRPYRTYAAWYLWRSLDGPVTPGLGL